MGEEHPQYRGATVVEQQSAHYGRTRVYRDDKRWGVVVIASPRVKYINVDEVQMTVEMKCEPAELAENHDADNFEELLEEVSDIENNSEVFGKVMKQKLVIKVVKEGEAEMKDIK